MARTAEEQIRRLEELYAGYSEDIRNRVKEIFNEVLLQTGEVEESYRRTIYEAEELVRSTRSYVDQLSNVGNLLEDITVSLATKHDAYRRIKQLVTGIGSINSKLLAEDRLREAYSVRELETLTKRAGLQAQLFKDQKEPFLKSLGIDTTDLDGGVEEAISRVQQQLSATQMEMPLTSSDRKRKIITIERLTGQLEILGQYKEQKNVFDDIYSVAKERLRVEKDTEKVVGATGALLRGMGKIMSTLGLDHLSAELKEIKEGIVGEIRMKVESGQLDSFTAKTSTSLKVLFAGLSRSTAVLVEGLFDPLFILSKILVTYGSINKANVEVKRLTGQGAVAQASWNLQYANAIQYLQLSAELTKTIGFNVKNSFDSKVLGQAATLQATLGITAEEASKLAIISQVSTQNTKDLAENIVSTVSNYNRAKGAAVSQGIVLRDIARTSDAINLSLKNNPKALGEAAAAARRLGLALSDVDQIANSLLEFETSIQSELEAELLIGKQLNLERARELALRNDLKGLGEEILSNSATIREFGNMNRIQQEAYAKALGLSRDQLARIAYLRGLELNMTAQQAADAAKVTLSDMKRVEILENLTNSLTKIAGFFAPILHIVGSLLNIPIVPYVLLAGLAVRKLAMSFGSLGVIRTASGYMGTFLSTIGRTAPLEKFTEKISVAYNKAKDFLKTRMLGGTRPIAPETPRVSSRPRPGTTRRPGTAGPGGLVESINRLNMKQILKGSASILILSGALFIAAKAFQQFAAVEWTSVALGIAGLTGLAGVAMVLGNVGPAVIKGAAALAILSAALIPLGYALKLAAPGISAFGSVITATFEGIATVISAAAKGFKEILGEVTIDRVGGLFLLGPALVSAAAGLTVFSVALVAANTILRVGNFLTGGKLLSELQKLAVLAEPLTSFSQALSAVAGSFSTLSTVLANLDIDKLIRVRSNLVSTSIISKLTGGTIPIPISKVQSVAPINTTPVNTKNETQIVREDQRQDGLVKEVQGLREDLNKLLRLIVDKQGDVYIDGNKVGRALSLSATKSA